MHYRAKRGLAIACRPSVTLSVRLSVTLVDQDHRLEILETNCNLHSQLAQHLRSSYSKGHSPTPWGTWGNYGETRGGVGKSGVLEHKSSNISETRKDRGKVTMEGL